MAAPTILPGDLWIVTNNDSETVDIAWSNRTYTIKPGATAHVPAEGVINAFGDPRATDNTQFFSPSEGGSGMVPDRESEKRRLALRYGMEPSALDAHLSGQVKHPVAHIPKLTVKTLDNQEIHTVISDPDGKNVLIAPRTVAEAGSTKSIIEHLQRQIEHLSAQINADKEQGEIPEDDGAPEDSVPTPPPSSPPPDTPAEPPEVDRVFEDVDEDISGGGGEDDPSPRPLIS